MSKKRSDSSIFNLRVFHNWVKLNLLRKASAKVKDKIKRPNVLDLAVGRGGDLFKWREIGAKRVYGFDISDETINGPDGAIDRYQSRYARDNSDMVCSFHVLDLANPENIVEINRIVEGRKFAIVSCQFALHYFFVSETAIRALTSIIRKFIIKGGVFIATIIDKNKLVHAFTESNTDTIVKDLYRIERRFVKTNGFNNKYTISIGKPNEDHYFSKFDSNECLVDIDILTKLLKAKGMKKEDFSRIYKYYKGRAVLSDEEKEVSFLNTSLTYYF